MQLIVIRQLFSGFCKSLYFPLGNYTKGARGDLQAAIQDGNDGNLPPISLSPWDGSSLPRQDQVLILTTYTASWAAETRASRYQTENVTLEKDKSEFLGNFSTLTQATNLVKTG